MSKEQTPIKDLEFYKSNAEEDYISTPISVLRYISELENSAQAKVLEALESQKELIEELLTIFDGNGVPNIKYVTRLIKEYYETEVKPNYE